MQAINNKRIKAGKFLAKHISIDTPLAVISTLVSIYAFEMLKKGHSSIKLPTAEEYSLASCHLILVTGNGDVLLNFNPPRQILNEQKKKYPRLYFPQNTAVAKFNQLAQSGKTILRYLMLFGIAVVAIVGKQQKQGL